MTEPAFRRVYVWEWPVRLYHWLTVAAVAALVGTGLMIGAPVALASTREASANYWFGIVRFVHFAAAWVFFWAFVLRLYWMFAGNRFANWRVFLPFGRFGGFFRDLWKVIRTDILQVVRRPMHFIGHNPLAAMTYMGVFILTAFQIATGFALYAPMSGAWIPSWFAWVTPLLGGDAGVRLWHHATMWLFLLFVAVHVYLVVYHDVVESSGELSSMIGGSRFVERPIERH